MICPPAGLSSLKYEWKAKELVPSCDKEGLNAICGDYAKGTLGGDCLLRFIQMFLEIGHKGCAARSHSSGVARVGLMLAVNVAVGIADVDLAELGEEIDAGTIGSPKIRIAQSPIANITGEHRPTLIIGGLL